VAKIKDQGLRTRYAVNLDRWLGMMDERFVLTRVRAHAGDTGPVRRGGRFGQDRRNESRGEHSGPFGTNGSGSNGNGSNGGRPDGNGGQRPDNGQRSTGGQPYDLSDPVVWVEREALKLAVQRPALCGPEFDALGADAFTAPVHKAVFTLIAACGGSSAGGTEREWAARLREEAPNERAQSFVTALAVESLRLDREPDVGYADALLAKIGELAVSREIAMVKARLQRTNPVEDQPSYNRLFGDLVGLEKRRKALLDRGAGL
jgi:DNA primase